MSQTVTHTDIELTSSSSARPSKTCLHDVVHTSHDDTATPRLDQIPALSSTQIANGVPVPHSTLSNDSPDGAQNVLLGKKASILLIVHVFLVYVTTSVTTGLITIGIPAIASDIKLDQSLIYWPILIYTLTCAAFLLLAGAVADVIGRRQVTLFSLLFLGIFNLGCSLAKTGQQLIAFRAVGGITLAFFLPTSLGLISTNMAEGKLRNVGFSLLGAGQVIGYALGLSLGGILVSSVGWRVGYYLCSGLLLVLFATGFWALPANRKQHQSLRTMLQELRIGIDWVGIALSSSALAMLAYVLAQVSVAASNIKQPVNIALLTVGLVLMPTCIVWFGHQEKNNRPALIPNSLWKRLPFSTMCVMTMFGFAEMQTMELLASLFFQQIQGCTAIQASIRILPSLVVGIILEIGTGAFVHRIPAVWLVASMSALSAAAPILMAITQPDWPYWWTAFPAQILFPLSIDVLFTVALLLISSVFPSKDQALAGAVFNVTGQFGQALGLAIIGVITNTVTEHDSKDLEEGHARLALMKGYRAGFWTAFAWVILLLIVCVFGLRKVGKVGVKRD